jgi:hypothetical protein
MDTKVISFLCLSMIILSGCQSNVKTSTITADFRDKSGVYIVGYTDNETARSLLESALATNLRKNDIVAYASSDDFPTITTTTPAQLRAVAKEKKVISVIILNRVSTDANDSVVKNPTRISPLHPTLQEFYAVSKSESVDNFADSDDVFVEVNLFIVDGDKAKLYWSGTTWTKKGTEQNVAISDVAKTISEQLVILRNAKRS